MQKILYWQISNETVENQEIQKKSVTDRETDIHTYRQSDS